MAGSYATYKVCEWVYNNRIEDLKVEHQLEIIKTRKAERDACAEAMDATRRSGDELQKKYKNINDRFNNLNNKLLTLAPAGACVDITQGGQRDVGRAGGDVLPVLGRIEATEFIGKLKQADTQTATLMQCQAWVRMLEDKYGYKAD
ncbi:hypothetical protein EKK58_09080 [Candidatus Dependentiae bacterium]|nr:MAG: hypothetical protein EKK58_09080 [Candidatus Dependentiae bacterium]